MTPDHGEGIRGRGEGPPAVSDAAHGQVTPAHGQVIPAHGQGTPANGEGIRARGAAVVGKQGQKAEAVTGRTRAEQARRAPAVAP